MQIRNRLLDILILTAGFIMAPLLQAKTDSIPVAAGEIKITPNKHASPMPEYGEKVIDVDPWTRGKY